LLAYREVDDLLALTTTGGEMLADAAPVRMACLWQSVFGPTDRLSYQERVEARPLMIFQT